MAIPKIIHYCWFGDGQIPEENQAYIDEWKSICPDYQIIKWDESNYDINKVAFMREAAKFKKWAFVSDYARIDVVNTFGGIYLDVDVQLLKSYNAFLNHQSFWGIEKDFNRQLYVAPGLGFGSVPNNPILIELLDLYNGMHFDNNNLIAIPVLCRSVFEKRGFVQKNRIQKIDGGVIYPTEFFDTMNCFGKIKITKNSISTHHYLGSWIKKPENNENMLFKKCVYYFGEKTGEYVFQGLKRIKRIGKR